MRGLTPPFLHDDSNKTYSSCRESLVVRACGMYWSVLAAVTNILGGVVASIPFSHCYIHLDLTRFTFLIW